MDGTEVAVRSVRTVGSDTVAIELETPEGFDARPGQFVQLAATINAEEITRHYTLSSPDATDTFEVTVEVDPEGSLSPYLAGLEPGATVEVAGPFGNSYYEGEERVVVLAGGPGVGPAVGIGERAVREAQRASDGSSGDEPRDDDGSDVTVVYEDADPAHEDRLAALAATGATVVVTDDIEAADVAGLLADARGQVFVYGFAEFLERATGVLSEAGLDGDTKTENFGPAP